VRPFAMTMTVTGDVCASWVSRLVQIPSVNPLHQGPSCGVPGEKAVADFLASAFTDLGATEVVLEEVLEGRPNVYAFFPGRSDRLVALDVHTDTVTVENMVEPPFDGRIAGGCVWGRGALDTKASLGVICALMESWKKESLKPEANLLVVGSISEEAGGLLGASQFRAWAERRALSIDQLVICEPTGCAPIHGHKGAIGLTITVMGESAHSSTPERGRNAIFAAAKLISALEAHHEELVHAQALTEVGTGTLLVAMITGGIAGNVVPDRCVLTVGRRLVPGEDVQYTYDRLVELATRSCPLPIEVQPIFRTPEGLPGSPAFYQTADCDLVRTLAMAAGTAAATAPFGTNALRYDGFANEKVIFGPGSIDDAHRSTECVEIADLEKTAAAYTAWLRPA
jgi:acetylornithine deacetylase/succinyl-diaminopimelate desuccinylase-like protein